MWYPWTITKHHQRKPGLPAVVAAAAYPAAHRQQNQPLTAHTVDRDSPPVVCLTHPGLHLGIFNSYISRTKKTLTVFVDLLILHVFSTSFRTPRQGSARSRTPGSKTPYGSSSTPGHADNSAIILGKPFFMYICHIFQMIRTIVQFTILYTIKIYINK